MNVSLTQAEDIALLLQNSIHEDSILSFMLFFEIIKWKAEAKL